MGKLLGTCIALTGLAALSGVVHAGVLGSPISLSLVSHQKSGDRTYSAVYDLNQTGNGPASLVSGTIPGLELSTIHQTVPNATGTGDVVTFWLMPTGASSSSNRSILSNAQALDLLVSGFSNNGTNPATGSLVIPSNIGFAEFNGDFASRGQTHHVRLDAPNPNFQFTHTVPNPTTGIFSLDFHLSLPRSAGALDAASHFDFSLATSGGQSTGGQEAIPEPADFLVWCGLGPLAWLAAARSRRGRSIPWISQPLRTISSL